MQFSIKKGDFDDFVKAVISDYDFYAPVKGDSKKKVQKSQFSIITEPRQIHLDINTYFPVKSFFFDKKECLFHFSGNEIQDPVIEIKDRVLFGLRKCDLNGIHHQDIVFLEENEDPFYKTRRDATVLLGVHCKEGDEYCFCNSLELKDFHDAMFYEQDEKYVVEIGSEKGAEFIKKYNEFFEESNVEVDKNTKNTLELKHTNIKDIFEHEGWKELSDTCLSCGACNNLCPNCHCFTIQDEVEFDLKTGKRVRIPASCQLREFTRVAGDHVFRDARVERFKHRIYHQIEYFRDRHDEIFCTGCGRCIRGCPVRIDWVTKINEMKNDN